MSAGDRKRFKHTGKGKSHDYLQLFTFMLESAEFSALSGSAIKLLLDVGARYKGSNNGDLSIVWKDLRRRGWSSQGTVHRAKTELLASGFLICTRHGGKNRCSLYGITWKPIDACTRAQIEVAPERVASHLWRQPPRDPEKQNPCSQNENELHRNSEQSGQSDGEENHD